MGSPSERQKQQWTGFRARCYRIIFHSERPAEKLFDVALIVAIMLSVLVVMLESVATIRAKHGPLLYRIEWSFTLLFTAEYLLRIYVAPRPTRYIRSGFGIVDLLAILPTYLDLLLPGAHYLMLLRSLRALRVFRVLKMANYVGEAALLGRALRSSRRKITIFLFWVLTLVVILGSVMYLVEGPAHGFSSIPTSVYWAIVTLTTVGYGDLVPQTPLGQAVASMIMIIGYSIIAVPTGIVTAEIAVASQGQGDTRVCPQCGARGHDRRAAYCDRCGSRLE